MTKVEDKAKKINNQTAKEIFSLKGARPNLAIIYFDQIPEYLDFIKRLEKEAKTIGIDTHTYKCESSDTEEEITALIHYLNNDALIDAILIKAPIPEILDKELINSTVNSEKKLELIASESEEMEIAELFRECLEKFKNK